MVSEEKARQQQRQASSGERAVKKNKLVCGICKGKGSGSDNGVAAWGRKVGGCAREEGLFIHVSERALACDLGDALSLFKGAKPNINGQRW